MSFYVDALSRAEEMIMDLSIQNSDLLEALKYLINTGLDQRMHNIIQRGDDPFRILALIEKCER